MSKQIQRIFKNRVLVTLLAVTAVWFTFTALLVPNANACPNAVRDYTYYTDDTYTVVCGYQTYPCCGGVVYSQGCKTIYYTLEWYPCY